MKTRLHLKFITLLLITFSSVTFAQKLERIKGSKVVTTSEIALDSVVSLELFKDVKLTLVQGDEEKLTIYADDNLHDIVDIDLVDGKLSLSLLYKIARKKKFELTLQLINLEELILNSNSEIINNDLFTVDNINIMLNDKSDATIIIEAADSILYEAGEKSKSEVSFKANKISYELSGSAKVKGSSNCDAIEVNLQDRAVIELVGKCDSSLLTANENAKIKMTNVTVDTTEISASGKADIYTYSTSSLLIDIKDNVRVYFYGKAKVELNGFSGNVSLLKKE